MYKKEDTLIIDNKKSLNIKAIKIAIVNLMPNKEEAEIQILKYLSSKSFLIKVGFIRTFSYVSKN
ncbi:homoserine O-succinyltransferase [uncultured Anaerococcus sp.]|uniref:homoserine O-acetyltransferase/O-succinyltransferase family protein n=1 Tax=uncultured Anaerococcus sp. TaxID=293428 RepID=UPI00345C847D